MKKVKENENEKVYLTRDEGDDNIYIWRKPLKGNWSPVKMPDCDIVCYHREDIEHMDYYHKDDFKKKFGIIIPKKTRKCCHLPTSLLNNEDYKLISNDPDRKK